MRGRYLCVGACVALSACSQQEGCSSYREHDRPLIAHAGGGLPDGLYTNSRAAMDLAVKNGFTLIELDFIERDGALLIGHDEDRMSELTLEELFAWLEKHPDVRIVTDIKTGNDGLRYLAPHADRFIPQIYYPREYGTVRRLGFDDIIFTAYGAWSNDWITKVNKLDLFAVTIPMRWVHVAPRIEHELYLHTFNRPMGSLGLYTDCLIPEQAS
ncbi:PI-PLC domain-containing protein [Sphingomicrobium marinum]|uniref:hypothetical protein n=1 Tax=Sphingomicrobium marinum TaxID=1227950 RepID=UPI00223FE9BC|nr:hypothetical protein [Sphingomicrobium marinum]